MEDFVSMYQTGGSVEGLVTSMAGSFMTALTDLGSGSCLLQDDVTLVGSTLAAIPAL